jgi:hypothetical protein
VVSATVGAIALLAGFLVFGPSAHGATSLPADKVTTTGSKLEVMPPGGSVQLLSVQMKTSTPEDLILQFTSECSIVTDITTSGNDEASAEGQVRSWITVDGKPVGVVPSTPGTSGDGKVVLCNRAYKRTTSQFGGQETIEDHLASRQANGFNWVTLNVGNGVHTIQVWGEFTNTATNKGLASSAVGNRTLVVQPTSYAIAQP